MSGIEVIHQARAFGRAFKRYGVCLAYFFGLVVLSTLGPESAWAYTPGKFGEVCGKIITALSDEDFGSLLAALAGIGAIVASAMGGFKAAWALLVVSVGSFILDSYISIWFDTCGGGGGA